MPVIKTRNGNKWSESQFNSFIKSMLRRGSTRWGPKYTCKQKARLPDKYPNDKGRLVFHSTCASCGGIFPETTCSVDHIEPVVDPNKGFTSWDDVIERLFCEEDGLQVLCKECHDIKTNKEKAVDRERRKHQKS